MVLTSPAAAGDADAMYCLGALLYKQGRRGEAKEWAKQWKRQQPQKWWQPTHVERSGLNFSMEWNWGWTYFREGKKEWNW